MLEDDDRTIARRPRPPRGSVPPRTAPSSPMRWILLGLAAIAAGVVLTLWWLSRAQLDSATLAPTTATQVPLADTRPSRQDINLPPLDDSDTLLRQLVSSLSKHPMLAWILVNKSIVRSAVLAVVQIGDGVTPVALFGPLKPQTRLQINAESSRVDPATYRRWEQALAALTSINTAELAQTYVNVKPLFDEAYRELGHPNGNFDDAIVRAIRTLDATPDVKTDPVLLKRPGYFEHDDESLRALLPVQKQLLLLGPAHRVRVISWVRQLAASLDLKID
jgi:hypothetical protein